MASEFIEVSEGVFLASHNCLSVRPDPLVHYGSQGQGVDVDADRLLHGVHHVLGVLVPHGLVPLALDALALSLHFGRVVAEGAPAILLIDFFQPRNHLGGVHVPQTLLLVVAVYVGRRHVWVVVAAHVQLQPHVRVLLHELSERAIFEGLANALRASTKVAKVHANVLELRDTPTDHIFCLVLIIKTHSLFRELSGAPRCRCLLVDRSRHTLRCKPPSAGRTTPR